VRVASQVPQEYQNDRNGIQRDLDRTSQCRLLFRDICNED
jgi:hypothetical protein